ncbi:MAG: RHS repeat-associated core domain-containing protein, partial [Desulfobacterales bacterium]|nr:RHS repeat-associated core domain-containing protein [Desulfobacterales bacterium]
MRFVTIIYFLVFIFPQSVQAACFVGVFCEREAANAAIEEYLDRMEECGNCKPDSYNNRGCEPRDSWSVSRGGHSEELLAEVPCYLEDGLGSTEYNTVARFSIDFRSGIIARYIRDPDDYEISCFCAYQQARAQKDTDFEWGAIPASGAFCPYKSNPVNIINGNKYESSTDISIATPFWRGLHFVRYYNSQSVLDGTMGFGWTHNYQFSLNPNHGENRIKIKQGDGRGIYFLFDSTAMNYKGTLGENTSVETDGLTYTWKRDNSLDYIFNNEGVLLEIQDAVGNKQILTYDAEGRLEAIIDEASGRFLQLNYTSDGKIEHIAGPITDAVPDGILVSYSYENQNLASVEYADSSGFIYTYADPHDLHNITSKEDKEGHLIASWTYDDQDRVTYSIARDAEDLALEFIDENATKTTDAYGIERTYHFAEEGGMRRILSVDNTSGCASCREDVVAASYDVKGRLVTRTMANGRIDRFTDYDALGRARTFTMAEGTPEEKVIYRTYHPYLYQELSRREASVIGNGDKETIFDYDNDGNDIPNENPGALLTRTIERGFMRDITGAVVTYEYITTMAYNTKGQITQMDGPLPGSADAVNYTYDPTTGDLLSVDYPEAGAMNYTNYDAAGLVRRIIDENQQGIVLTYDARGRVLTQTREADGYQITSIYNNAGKIAAQRDSEGFGLTYDYDATYGRLSRITDSLGNYITYDYDANGNRTEAANFTSAGDRTFWQRFNYEHPDQPGKLWKVINPDDTFTTFGYDSMGQVNTVTDPLLKVTDYTHDFMKRITRESRPGGVNTDYSHDRHGNIVSVTDAEGLTTAFVYDDMGRKVSEHSPDRGTIHYAYDAAGNLIGKTDALEITITYSYDDRGRLTSIAYPDTSQDIRYIYDQGTFGTGRLTGMSDPSGTASYTYDNRGFMVSESRAVDNVTYTTSYRYAANGVLAGITYPDGREVDYALNSQGQVTAATTKVNGITKILAQNIEYQPFGPRRRMTLGSGKVITNVFDQQQRMIGIEATGILELAFYHDAAGNVTAIDNLLDATRNQTFSYDDLYRLTGTTGVNGPISFTYDKVGNRLTRTAGGQTDTYTYEPDTHRLAAIDGAAPLSFGYDAAGNMIARGDLNLAYNQNNRLISVTQGGATQGAYTYNGNGQRVQKTASGQTVVYHWDQYGNLIAESDEAGNFSVSYVYLGAERLAAIKAGHMTNDFGVDVRTDEGRSLSDINVYAFRNGAYTGMSTVTDEAGRALFTKSGFADGSYTFRADYLGNQFWSSQVTFPTASGALVEIPESNVTVLVTQNGAVASGVKVYLFSDSGAYLGQYAVTDGNGQANFMLPADQQYTFRTDLMGNRYFSEIVAVSKDAPNTISVNTGGGILEVVLDRGDGTAIADVKTYLFSMEGAYLGRSETSAALGRVAFDVPAGDYKVRADYLGNHFWTQTISVSTDTSETLVIPHQTVNITLTGDYDGDARPIADGRIFLFTEAGSYQNLSATTDVQGKVSLSLPPGQYKVRADYLGQQYWSTPFDQTDVAVVIEEAMAHVAVTLFDLPIEDVPVYLFDGSNRYLGISTVTTDEDFIALRLPAGEYNCRADEFGNQYFSGPTTLIAHQENPINISTGGGNFALTVEKTPGRPLSGVTCFLFSESGRYLGRQTATDVEGIAGFDAANGLYTIRIDYMGYQYWTPVFEIPTQIGMTQLVDHVDSLLTVSHGMYDENIPGADLKAYLFTASGAYQNLAETTNAAGEATFNLPPGEYKYRVDYMNQQFWSDVINQSDADIYIPAGKARVQVSQASNPVEGVPVYLFTATDNYLKQMETTDIHGEALFQVPAGNYKFRADHLDSQYWASATITADTETPVRIPTGGGNLDLSVQKNTGEPIAGVSVYLFSATGSYLGENQVTDESGMVDFDLSNGSYKLRVDYLGYQYWSDNCSIPGISNTSLPIVHRDITVKAGATYRTERLAIENANTYVFTPAGSYQRINARTDSSGSTMFNLPDQAYKVRLDYLGRQYWSPEFNGTDTQVDIPHGYVHLEVTDTGSVIAGARVYLFTETGAYLNRNMDTATSGEASFFIPEGAYKFRVDYDGRQYWSDTIHIIGHEDIDLPLDFGLLVQNQTNNPHPQRYDGTPPKFEPQPVYLASLMSLPGILSQAMLGATPQDAVYYFLNDHLGTPLKVVDESGVLVWEANYEPFGGVNTGTQSFCNNFRFPGQYYDQETGLYYNNHRYYEPLTGRYLTTDPIGLEGGINHYAYVKNNPINFIDPFGLSRRALLPSFSDPFTGLPGIVKREIMSFIKYSPEIIYEGVEEAVKKAANCISCTAICTATVYVTGKVHNHVAKGVYDKLK